MDNRRQCPSCGRQFEEAFQFCPFDATPLARKCPTCGKTWDIAFQFCPLDSTPLAQTAAPPQPPAPESVPATAQVEAPGPPAPVGRAEAPPPRPAPAPSTPPPAASVYKPKPTAFTFAERAQPAWKTVLLRPMTILFALGAMAVGFAVWYLDWITGGPDLPPPVISYALMTNEGKTKGVPVAIKVSQLTVFMIDDPMDTGEGAARAKKLVATLEEVIKPLKESPAVRFAVDTVEGRPALLEIVQNAPSPRTLASVTEGDAILAGETDASRLASQWAERLTDAVKVFVFGEVPSFSTETEFGQALLAMYKAAAGSHGKITKRSLDAAFERLTADQRKALETPPLVKRQEASTPPARKEEQRRTR
ncbi:MAG: zinc ribbon domain-containing protein [Acidobacteria bacterium]|nr:zinc ribbon domain-containing protein [Acidobacteriota bacterium]